MAALPPLDECRVFSQVTGIADPVAECRKRWPDLAFREEIQRTPTYSGRALVASWTRDGVPRGLTSPLSLNPTPEERREAERHIAVAAILRAEHDKLSKG